jgi:tRNA pseudouridine55 synthase
LKSEDFLSGQLLLIDKDLHWTSFDVVNKLRYSIRRIFSIKKIKVGHAGTLDPLATGLLIICTGRFTKRINEFMGLDKEYTGIIRLGSTTPSYDLESEPDEEFPTDHITDELIQETIPNFTGEIQQRPPVYSAILKDGKRAYELARKGEKVELKERSIRINQLEITRSGNDLHFRVNCSKGTYIRSLAHDFGKALHSGAHLAELRRTKIGDFSVNDAQSVDEYLKYLETTSA